MKRNKNLETLSWEHHDGLVIAFRMEKGINNNVAPDIVAQYLLYIWDHSLQHHFWQEEESLTAPLQATSKGRELLQQMLDEHRQFKNIVSTIRSNNKDYTPYVMQFYQKLNKHIRFEERKLFPLVEELCSESELKNIGIFLHKNHQPGKKEWNPEFWREKDE